MTTLEERVRALEDEKAILQTLVRYAQCMDQGQDAHAFLECFTESAVWWASIEGPWAGAGGSRHTGHEDLGRFFNDLMRTRDSHPGKAKHYVVTPDISVMDDRASAETYHLEVSSYQDGPRITSMGRYIDEFVRCPDGRWRIQERHLLREGAGAEAQKRSTR